MNKAGALLVILATLPACSLFGARDIDVQVTEKIVPVVCDTSTRPDALNLKDTPPTLVMDPNEVWGYWFNSELYAGIAENLQAMRRYMTQSNDIRVKLVRCIDEHNASASDSP